MDIFSIFWWGAFLRVGRKIQYDRNLEFKEFFSIKQLLIIVANDISINGIRWKSDFQNFKSNFVKKIFLLKSNQLLVNNDYIIYGWKI